VRGFSLIELSIVLVILGLLTGGILAGQSLIRASELRSVSAEFQRYSAAAYTFRDKYFGLPGDLTNATAFWGKDNTNCSGHSGNVGTPGTCNGNGNGQLNDGSGATVPGEQFGYWQQLALAGLIEGTYSGLTGSGGGFDSTIGSNVPRSKISNTGWSVRWIGYNGDAANAYYYVRNYGNVLYFGRETPSAETADDTLKPEEAWNIDTKMDDGKPNTGKITSFKRSNSYTPNCVNAATEYDLLLSSVECSLLVSDG
jgi:prepilin-type N-terminal cleavage/methylation domain-containing protein